jgi:photosystem II stability/assembly factor-like uncharacterized protein
MGEGGSMVKRLYLARTVTGLAALATISGQAPAQQAAATPAPAPLMHEPTNPALRGFRWRSIGPTSQGVRVDDIAVDEKNPTTYYVGYAVTGIVKTVNNGTTFEPIFDTYGSASIADIALAPSDPNIIYVATGEANNRQTTSYGDGMYKSTDAGKTFTKIGFENSQTLGRVLVHPRDPNTVWVAVGGYLYAPNADRGVYMTTDGGKTWNKTLYVDPNTSATEIVIDPSNPQNLWAAMYQRQRTAWGFNGGGPGSGIYNSTDGGRSWKRVTGAGLPRGTMGRVALDFCKSNPNVLYAQIEVAQDKEPQAALPVADVAGAGRGGRGGGGGGGGGGGRGGPPAPPNPQSSGVWRSADKGRSWTFMSNENQRPMYFSQIRVDPNHCDVVYLGGVGPTKSTDGGKTWSGLNNMGHVDNHAIWIDPLNSNHVMYGNDGGLDVSWDGGAHWDAVRLNGVGLSYHASVDMRRPYYVCTGLQDNGSWCGPSSVRENGGIKQWMWQRVGGGDGFQSAIDPTDYNIFYTESQNAGINRYDMNTGEQRNIKPNYGGGGRGGAGGGGGGEPGGEAPVAAAPTTGRGNVINPTPNAPLQFNWNNPIRLSPHNPRTIMIGGRSMFISRDRGNTWWQTKPLGKGVDLTKRQIMGVPYSQPSCGGRGGGAVGIPCILSKNDGYVANEFGTITEIAESPIIPGVLWAGTDDGNIQVSQDGGNTWEEVGKNIPGVDHEYYVSGLEASWYEAGTAYAALDGHRNNDLKPYVFKTTDYGKTWTSVTGNLPTFGNVNSIRQDPVNKNLLYAPTELGFYISLDDGKNWHKFMPNLPTGRTDDVVVHPRDNDLVLATHSRSVWIMDDITALQRLTPDALEKQSVLFPVRDAIAWKTDRRIGTATPGDRWWAGENAPRGTVISYHLKSGGGDAKITISDAVTGREFRTQTGTSNAGMNRWIWNLCSTPQPGQQGGGRGGGGGGGGGGGCQGGGRVAPEGVYRVVVTVGGLEVGNQVFKVLEDVWLQER